MNNKNEKKIEKHIEFNELDKLYNLFQFEKLEEINDIGVYLFYNGYFKNIEIVSVNPNNPTIDLLRKKYELFGYSVSESVCSSLEEAHDKLFDGFFYIERFIQKCNNEYESFCNMQTGKLRLIYSEAEYEYIEGDFYINNEFAPDRNLVEYIGQQMLTKNPKLIILEAAAGMGKTSTAYEVFDYLLKNREEHSIPLFIELTKNRGARIFRHVLDDEINRNFAGLKRELVIEEIKRGNILLIIDGFDELLTKKHTTEDGIDDNENAQTMLDTIAELFDDDSKARIVLTSRKSSIFVGSQFDSWVDAKLSNPEVTVERCEIAKPTIKQWLGIDKLNVILKKNVPEVSLENPVLLSFLRNISIDEINAMPDGKSIVDKYFERLLERERERQDLVLTIEEQRKVYTDLASKFVIFEIKAENSDFIKDLFITEILKDNINDYLSRYTNTSEKPNEEEFVMKFVRHALLDRIKPSSNNLGFVNDFVFGIFIADAVNAGLLTCNNMELVSNNYITLAVDAFAIENEGNKKLLYSKLKELINLLNIKQQLNIELELIRNIGHDYKDEYIDGIIFNEAIITDYKFMDCTFVNCVFEKCLLNPESFENCIFIRCKFYETALTEDIPVKNLSFVNCLGENIFILSDQEEKYNDIIDYRKKVLENFWAPGKDRAETRRSENAIYRGSRQQDRANIAKAINELLHDEIITFGYSCYLLNYDKIGEIKEILGR
ncbi:MAG: NACHT domain-containing protein [Clostridia bacterium]|nr:NACHT domain-containing protein [Clostridia bacterium]